MGEPFVLANIECPCCRARLVVTIDDGVLVCVELAELLGYAWLRAHGFEIPA